ncbi:MAG: AAA domain-containing protein [bacterium]
MKNAPLIDPKKGLDFIRDVAKYFMDFLETDFHKRKLPKRSIKFRNNDNLLIGINLQKYQSFNKLVFKLIDNDFKATTPITIEKGVYKTSLPKNLLNLIKLQVGKISAASVKDTIEKIGNEIEKFGTLHIEEYDLALTKSIEAATAIIKEDLVSPFVSQVEKPLQNLELGDEDNIFLIEEELVGVLVKPIESKISEVLNLFIAKKKVDINKEIKSVFETSDVKATVSAFFNGLEVADLYAEFFEMERNRTILDKQEFYLYFGDISFNNNKYPIFYIPFAVTRVGEVFNVDFDSQIYINKRAVEFIVQEHNNLTGKKGNLKTVSDRIIYLGKENGNVIEFLQTVLSELVDFFELSGEVDFLANESKIAKGKSVRISNTCSINLADKSDEALVNDYEEILQQLGEDGGGLAGVFQILIDDFIYKNPDPFNPQVEDEWDNTSSVERLVPSSPIPLNSEQLQILSAIRKEGCKYIIVEGPPGTGKSHTITAIIFDAILKNQSILVLSDKKEALDVVEDKITQTMNKVRFDKNFQNPILRLGKTGSTYGSILAKPAIENIKTHLRATKKDYDVIGSNIDKLSDSLKEDLDAEITAYKEISLEEIHELFDLEPRVEKAINFVSLDEILKYENSVVELGELREACVEFSNSLKSDNVLSISALLGIPSDRIADSSGLRRLLSIVKSLHSLVDEARNRFAQTVASLSLFGQFDREKLSNLEQYVREYSELKSWLFGYFFSKNKVRSLDEKFKKSFVFKGSLEPHQHISELLNVVEIGKSINQLSTGISGDGIEIFDPLSVAHGLLTDDELFQQATSLSKLADDLNYFDVLLKRYPATTNKIGIDLGVLSTVGENNLTAIEPLEFDRLLRYIGLKQKINGSFSKIPELNFASRKQNLEDLVTARATYLLDGRLINFYENNRSDAETLKNIIKNKQRFPKDEFAKLKEAFPCILAGIRDYAEYIPLEAQIFDLVIIDEASQVSIAQAFPALLRAKKVLILGDKKQFSNIKAAQARSDTNREYLNNLGTSFKSNVSTDATKLIRLGKFNIKTSILEFFEFISNYNIQLLKHFRGYKEIISYSNKYFYQESLQVMKIRGKPIDDVLQFSFVEAGEKDELYPNTNAKEVEFIITQLRKLKEENKKSTVGIITPHTNQQKLLMEQITKLPERDYYFDELGLKIMTFDTCQGEERDIIFYSMVASKYSDKLWGVFIKDLSSVDIEEDGQIKAQRLNVGLSRAKECMHFVLSKPIDDFSGSIGDALRHYYFVRDEAKKEKSVAETDQKSKMEPEVLNWFYQTSFWNENKDRIDFLPQFQIGKYLRQLDRTYTHPDYEVDFLLVYKDESHHEHKIIIEYDGFREHFKDVEEVNEYNYRSYYSDADVYREKVLESYGYKFLRINKFNIGENPIATFDARLQNLVKMTRGHNPLLVNIHETIEGLQNGDKKECPKCKEVRDLKDFKDSSLNTGYGRFCSFCKGKNKVQRSVDTVSTPPVLTNEKCPRCASKMILRDGRRGKFYGCSRFPYCKGTKNFTL